MFRYVHSLISLLKLTTALSLKSNLQNHTILLKTIFLSLSLSLVGVFTAAVVDFEFEFLLRRIGGERLRHLPIQFQQSAHNPS